MKLLKRMERDNRAQAIIATHAPLLMAYPGATLLRMTKDGLDPVDVAQTEHFRLLREFFLEPRGFIEAMMEL